MNEPILRNLRKPICLLICITASACGTKAMRDTRCVPPTDLTTLSGTYQAKNIGINSLGKHEGTSKLSIVVDADGIISGKRSWESSAHFGHEEDGSVANGDTEKVIGILDPLDCEIGLAEYGESGTYRGRLLPDGSIDLVLVESGALPVVIRNHYVKQEAWSM